MEQLEAAVHAVVRGLYKHPKKLFPTQQPQSINRTTLEKIFASSSDFVVSQKADGLHMTLILGTIQGPCQTKFCCLMDRTGKLVFYEVTCHPKFFLGTLLTGEVLPSKTHDRLFLAFDMVACAGECFLNRGYSERMAGAFHLQTLGSAGQFSIKAVDFSVKPFYSLDRFLQDFKPVSEDDGLVFMPLHKPLTQTLPFKWKENNTVDLLIEGRFLPENGPAAREWAWEVKLPIGIGRFIIDTTCPIIKTLENFMHSTIGTFSVIMECLPGSGNIIVPVKIRHDKKTPNLTATVLGTLSSIEDNITREDLITRFLAL